MVLYELLCDRTPFSAGESIARLLIRIRDEAPPSPRAIKPALPRDLDTICRKAMSKHPAHRYEDCGELADDLRRYLLGEPIHSRRVGAIERTVRWCRREPATAGLVAAVFLSLAVGGIVASYFAVTAERRARENLILAGQEAAAREEAQRHSQAAEEARKHEVAARALAEKAFKDQAAALALLEASKHEAEQNATLAEMKKKEAADNAALAEQ